MSNSVQRLMKIINEAIQQESNFPVKTVWANVLGTSPDNDESYSGLTKLLSLIQEVRDDVATLPMTLDVRWLHDIEKRIYKTQFDSPWSSVKPGFEYDIKNAGDTASLLEHFHPEPTIDDSELDQFQEEINQLLNDVISSKIDRDLKDFLQSHLREILVAVIDFKIKGTKGLKEAIQKTFAQAAMNQPIREKLDSSPFGKRLWSLILVFGGHISAIEGIIDIPDYVQRILPPPKPALVEQNPQHSDDKIDFLKPIPIIKNDDEEDIEPPEKKIN
jgi:hypothetical protein